MSELSPAALSLAALSVEYCKAVTDAAMKDPREVLRDIIRYLPRIYITLCDLRPYDEDADTAPEETGAIYDSVTEEQYDEVLEGLRTMLGANDMYLDTPVEEMRYSDTPVAVSLAEELADIYQNVADCAATIGQATAEMMPEVLSEMKYRFATYLSTTLCSALRASNYIYYNVQFDEE